MAFLVNPTLNQVCYLYAHHSFGRLTYTVNTEMSESEISKIHAIIEWENTAWNIRDLSRNGTWLNEQKLKKGVKYNLKLNDRIVFSKIPHRLYIVKDLDEPCDLLIPYRGNKTISQDDLPKIEAIKLQQYNLFPGEKFPEIAFYYEKNRGVWKIDEIGTNRSSREVNEYDVVNFLDTSWQLKLSHIEAETKPFENTHDDNKNIRFIFELSMDEENTQLQLLTSEKVVDLEIRIHHYLTLILARHRVDDILKGLKENSQGWVDSKYLEKALGLEQSHVNIQIHRARKQFVGSTNNFWGGESLIQRRPGQVRFAGMSFDITKGAELESSVLNGICRT